MAHRPNSRISMIVKALLISKVSFLLVLTLFDKDFTIEIGHYGNRNSERPFLLDAKGITM